MKHEVAPAAYIKSDVRTIQTYRSATFPAKISRETLTKDKHSPILSSMGNISALSSPAAAP